MKSSQKYLKSPYVTPPPLMGEGQGGGGQKEFYTPSPSSPPTRGGEIFGDIFLNVRRNFSNLRRKNLINRGGSK